MSSVVVPLGWDVNMAVAYPGPDDPVYTSGRLLLTGADGDKDAEYGYYDYPGYDGYGSGTEWRATADETYAAFLAWLTGSRGGKNVLVLSSNDPTQGDSFNSQFRAGLQRNGYTYTASNAANMTNGGAYDGLDFDVVCIQAYDNMPVPYHGQGTRALAWDYFFNNGGNALVGLPGSAWSSYGFPWTSLHWQTSHWDTTLPGIEYRDQFKPYPEFASSNGRNFYITQTQNVSSSIGMGGDIRPANPTGNYELSNDGTYICHNNTKGGHAWVKTCEAGSHPSGGGYEPVPLPIIGLWTKD